MGDGLERAIPLGMRFPCIHTRLRVILSVAKRTRCPFFPRGFQSPASPASPVALALDRLPAMLRTAMQAGARNDNYFESKTFGAVSGVQGFLPSDCTAPQYRERISRNFTRSRSCRCSPNGPRFFSAS